MLKVLMLKVLSSIFIRYKLKTNTKYAINMGVICQTPNCNKGCLIIKIVTFDFARIKITLCNFFLLRKH